MLAAGRDVKGESGRSTNSNLKLGKPNNQVTKNTELLNEYVTLLLRCQWCHSILLRLCGIMGMLGLTSLIFK